MRNFVCSRKQSSDFILNVSCNYTSYNYFIHHKLSASKGKPILAFKHEAIEKLCIMVKIIISLKINCCLS